MLYRSLLSYIVYSWLISIIAVTNSKNIFVFEKSKQNISRVDFGNELALLQRKIMHDDSSATSNKKRKGCTCRKLRVGKWKN